MNSRGRDDFIRPVDTPEPRGYDSPRTQRSRLRVITPQALTKHLPDQPRHALVPYEAVLLVSFGGPERPGGGDARRTSPAVGAFPTERLAEVGRHYLLFGGRSLINDQCRSLLDGIDERITRPWLAAAALLGNRNWDPYLHDELRADRARWSSAGAGLVTSAYPSYSQNGSIGRTRFDRTGHSNAD